MRHTRTPGAMALAAVLAISGLFVLRAVLARPRCWNPSEVPVAFWSWQNSLPSQNAVDRAASLTNARYLFVRAGQLDLANSEIRRINPATGTFPKGISLHLVYNSTESFLRSFERVDPGLFGATIAKAFADDVDRAKASGASVDGLQLDIDAPTRLLPHYARLLDCVRASLPAGVVVSITGLPSWMESPSIAETLTRVDFWIPQFYGGAIPERAGERIAITSPRLVARDVDRARMLGRPFFAGLAAYGYALHFDAGGALVELRGDIDPAKATRYPRLTLVEQSPFAQNETGDWRLLYRSSQGVVLDGLALRTGDYLMFDVPSSEGLRESARLVRERAGESLLGICVFRLPVEDDRTTLAAEEIAMALADRDAGLQVVANAWVSSSTDTGPAITLVVENTGSAAALPGPDALTVDLLLPGGGVRDVRAAGFGQVEYLSESGPGTLAHCSPRRASVIRLRAASWRPGDRPSAELRFADSHPRRIEARLAARLATGETRRLDQLVDVPPS